MKLIVAFPKSEDQRINEAMHLCRTSVERFQDVELIEISGTPRPLFNEMLQTSYNKAIEEGSDWFGWINGDCQLLRDLKFAQELDVDVYGLQRIEIGIGEQCTGVDGYIIKCEFWKNVLSKDIPQLYVGGTHIDWWISRAAMKFGKYDEGYLLAHIPHERTETSIGVDEFGLQNLKEYEAWAIRNDIGGEQVSVEGELLQHGGSIPPSSTICQ
jgi:hypothetical protein